MTASSVNDPKTPLPLPQTHALKTPTPAASAPRPVTQEKDGFLDTPAPSKIVATVALGEIASVTPAPASPPEKGKSEVDLTTIFESDAQSAGQEEEEEETCPVSAAVATTLRNSKKKRRLVSRRGGRCGSTSPAVCSLHGDGGLSQASHPEDDVESTCETEEKSVTKPVEEEAVKKGVTSGEARKGLPVLQPRTKIVVAKEKIRLSCESTNEVPSLCSSESICSSAVQLSSSSSSGSHQSPPHKKRPILTHQFSPMVTKKPDVTIVSKDSNIKEENEEEKPKKLFSIAVNADFDDISPLVNDNQEKQPISKPLATSASLQTPVKEVRDLKQHLSPTPSKNIFNERKPHNKFSSLGPSYDSKLNSPSCNIFLSPYSPSSMGIIGGSPFVRDRVGPMSPTLPTRTITTNGTEINKVQMATPTKLAESEHNVKSPSCDSTNMAFLFNSPFPPTPRGYENLNDTPRLQDTPRLPETPNNADLLKNNAALDSTSSFFLVDVPSTNPPQHRRDIRNHHPYSNKIQISPLASSKRARSGAKNQFKLHNNNGIDLQDFLYSPRGRATHSTLSPRSMPMDLQMQNNEGSHVGMNMNRDMMEDEDLSVLLQLASNTNNHGGNGGGTIIRSPASKYRRMQRDTFKGAPKLNIPPMRLENNLEDASAPRSNQQRNLLRNNMAHNAQHGAQNASQPLRSSLSNEKPSLISSSDITQFRPNNRPPAKKKPKTNAAKPKVRLEKNNSNRDQPKTNTPSQHDRGYAHYQDNSLRDSSNSANLQLPTGGIIGQGGGMHPVLNDRHTHGLNYHPPADHNMRMGRHYPPSCSPSLVPKVKMERHSTAPPYPGRYQYHYPPSYMSNDAMHLNAPSHLKKSAIAATYVSNPKKEKTPKGKRGAASGKARKQKIRNLPVPGISTGKNSQSSLLAAAILRGVTMRPSGKWQAQLYYAGKSRYIGVFDSREKAALAYEIAREKLKSDNAPEVNNQNVEDTEAAVSSARKAAFEGVNEPDPRPLHKR